MRNAKIAVFIEQLRRKMVVVIKDREFLAAVVECAGTVAAQDQAVTAEIIHADSSVLFDSEL